MRDWSLRRSSAGALDWLRLRCFALVWCALLQIAYVYTKVRTLFGKDCGPSLKDESSEVGAANCLPAIGHSF